MVAASASIARQAVWLATQPRCCAWQRSRQAKEQKRQRRKVSEAVTVAEKKVRTRPERGAKSAPQARQSLPISFAISERPDSLFM